MSQKEISFNYKRSYFLNDINICCLLKQKFYKINQIGDFETLRLLFHQFWLSVVLVNIANYIWIKIESFSNFNFSFVCGIHWLADFFVICIFTNFLSSNTIKACKIYIYILKVQHNLRNKCSGEKESSYFLNGPLKYLCFLLILIMLYCCNYNIFLLFAQSCVFLMLIQKCIS